MSSRETASDPKAIALPAEIVELKYLKAADGSPARVLCERIDELVYFKALGLPGLSMSAADLESKLKAIDSADLAEIKKLMPPIIEAGTAFESNGVRVAPAFSWDDAKCPPAIPGRYLSLEEIAVLSTTILRLSGFTTAEAEAASFLVRERAAGSESTGAGEVREAVRADADAGASGS